VLIESFPLVSGIVKDRANYLHCMAIDTLTIG